MKYLQLILFTFTIASCSQQHKEELSISTKPDTTDYKIKISDNDLILTLNHKQKVYKNLIMNEMSLSTELIKDNNGFILVYESNASIIKIKEKYDFKYSENGIKLISKEIIKFGKAGVSLNKIYIDDDMSQKTHNDLESIGNELVENFRSEPICFIYNPKNQTFGKAYFRQSPEDLFINFPQHITFNLIITDAELANNEAYRLEQINAHQESIFLLKNIIRHYPDRVVAYLNLADNYWKLNKKSEAKNSYQKYILLMKKQNKDIQKIPSRVFERTK